MTSRSSRDDPAFEPTLNGMGWMLCRPDAVMRAFVDFSRSQQLPVVDIGATFGVASLEALRAGSSVIATDIDSRHLERLAEIAASETLSARLQTISGPFPAAPQLPCGSVGAVLLSRILTFLSPAQVSLGFSTVADWLAPGGKVFGTADSYRIGNYRHYKDEFLRRRAAGAEWPGWIEQDGRHLFHEEILEREISRAGLTLERLESIDRSEYPVEFQSGGRESVLFVAEKRQ